MNPGKKILIIEDEDLIAMALRFTLEDLGYIVTDCLRSGSEVLSSIEKYFPDVILMDIKIEGELDGIDTAEMILKVYNIPVIFLTSYSNAETLERAKKINPFGYIIKPYQERELFTTIELTYHKHRHETQLQESERKYRELTESIQHIVVEFDHDGTILFLNQAGRQILGLPESGVLKVTLTDFMDLSSLKKFLYQLSYPLSNKDNDNGYDLILHSLANRIIYAKHYLTAVVVQNKITGYRGVIIDVSSDIIKNKLYQLYETITLRYNISTFNFNKLIGFIITSLYEIFPHIEDISYSYYNEEENVLTLRKEGTAFKRSDALIEYVFREKRAIHLKAEQLCEFNRLYCGNEEDERIKYRAGFPFFTDNTLNGVYCLQSSTSSCGLSCSDYIALAGFINSIESFIEKNLLAAKVKLSNERYSQLIESINEGVLQIDNEGKIVFVNNRFCEMIGLNDIELIGQDAISLLNAYPDKQKFLFDQFFARMRGESSQYEFQMPVKSGSVKHFIVNASPVFDASNKLTGSISTWIDITENRILSSMLSESEQKFREIANNISGAFWIIEKKSDLIQFVNPAFYEIFEVKHGISKKNILSAWKEMIHKNSVHPLFKEVVPATSVNAYDIQYRICLPSGKLKWVHEKASFIYNKSGELDRIVGYSTDITVRKLAEENLVKTEKEKEAILSQLLDTIVVIANNGDINNAYIKRNEEILFRIPSEKMEGKNISEVFPRSITEMLYSFISIRSENQNSHVFEYEYKGVREKKWFELRIVRGSNGNLIVIIRNITNEKHYFIEMRKFYNIISQTNELIMITDNTGKIEFTNDTFSRVTGYEMNEIMGRVPRFLNSGKHKRAFYVKMWKTILSRKSYSAEFINRKKNGELYYEEKIITPLINEKGDITKFISTGRDITEKKRAEKKLLAYARQEKLLEKRTEKLRTTALIQGQELERMRLAREIHDNLGQILTAVKFNIEHFKHKDFKNDHSQLLMRSIRKLVNSSIKETRKISDNLSPVGLGDYGLEYVVRKMIGEILSGKSIQISLVSNLKRTRFSSNVEINLFRIVQESINNALKHSKATVIKVALKYKDEQLKVTISDNGIGISDGILKSDKNKSYGLRNIRERAKIINASCKIITGKGKGTEIEILLKSISSKL